VTIAAIALRAAKGGNCEPKTSQQPKKAYGIWTQPWKAEKHECAEVDRVGFILLYRPGE
jgi:hypothetical protein